MKSRAAESCLEVLRREEVPSVEELAAVLAEDNPDLWEGIYEWANEVRERHVRGVVCIHGIIEFSNYCRRNCLYCGIRRENKQLNRYRMSVEEILDVADEAINRWGYKMLVLQSGDDFGYSTEDLVRIVKGVREKGRVLVFLSVGERDRETYEALHEAGAHGSLFRFETSDPDLYNRLHPGQTFEQRMGHLRFMDEIGYIIATGPIIGLPGQTVESLAKDILLMREMGTPMVTMGPFVRHHQTPLADEPDGPVEMTFRMYALMRLVAPRVRIPATTALETLAPGAGRMPALDRGANALMLNVTPLQFREQYAIYPRKICLYENPENSLEEFVTAVHATGRRVCKTLDQQFFDAPSKYFPPCK